MSEDLLRIQKRIYSSLKREVAGLLGEAPREIRDYERDYRRELNRLFGSGKPSWAGHEALLRKLARADIVLVADYHPYHQSQRTALRLLRQLREADPKFRVRLGLECFASDLQPLLDRYAAGKASAEAVRKGSRFDETWGFPFANYEPLLDWVRAHRGELVALNRPRALPTLTVLRASRGPRAASMDLAARDEWAAGTILDRWLADPTTPVWALYGEFHLASSHLPRCLAELARRTATGPRSLRAPRVVVLYQNPDELYFRLRRSRALHRSSALRLSPNQYALFSGTPWTKLQSLVNWIHGDAARFLDEESDTRSEFLSWMQRYGEVLRGTAPELRADFSAVGIRLYEEAPGRRLKPLFLAQERMIFGAETYAPSLSENSASELAAIWMRRLRQRRRPGEEMTFAEWENLVLDYAFGFFFSLWINPKRRAETLADHRARLRELRRRPSAALFPHELRARERAERILRRAQPRKGARAGAAASPPLLSPADFPRTLPLQVTLARFLGHELGARVYEDWQRDGGTSARRAATVRAFLGRRSFSDWMRGTRGAPVEAKKDSF